MRELSSVLPICQFFGFLIYISVRFIYISVTLLFTCFFSHHLAKIRAHAIFGCHLWHLWHLVDFKRFFLAIGVAKTCHERCQNPKPLILKGFFIVKCVMSLIYRALSQIIITLAIIHLYPLLLYKQCCYIKCVLSTSTITNKASNIKKF